MRKYRIFLTLLLVAVLSILGFQIKHEVGHISSGQGQQSEEEDVSMSAVAGEGEAVRTVCPSGEPIGIYVKTKGVMVIGVSEIEDENGEKKSPCKNLIQAGDYILALDGEEITDKASMIAKIQESGGEAIVFQVCRNAETFEVELVPVKDKKGNYVMGLWVKDDISGIGTLTYTDNGTFAALGHSINDNDTGTMFCVSDGALYETKIVNIKKPTTDTPGRLEGVINYSSRYVIGRVEENSAYGIHGTLTKRKQEQWKEENREEENRMQVAAKEEVHTGKAYLLSSVSGESCYYEIEIISVDSDNENGKCMEFVVKDKDLLALTGGIVQGMSGTPIIQDGKLIGAVTHVFVNHAEKGYGIFIESMM